MQATQSDSVTRDRRAEESLPEGGTTRRGWKSAFSALRSAAYRLHHYRNIRSQMLSDALRQLDCCR